MPSEIAKSQDRHPHNLRCPIFEIPANLIMATICDLIGDDESIRTDQACDVLKLF